MDGAAAEDTACASLARSGFFETAVVVGAVTVLLGVVEVVGGSDKVGGNGESTVGGGNGCTNEGAMVDTEGASVAAGVSFRSPACGLGGMRSDSRGRSSSEVVFAEPAAAGGNGGGVGMGAVMGARGGFTGRRAFGRPSRHCDGSSGGTSGTSGMLSIVRGELVGGRCGEGASVTWPDWLTTGGLSNGGGGRDSGLFCALGEVGGGGGFMDITTCREGRVTVVLVASMGENNGEGEKGDAAEYLEDAEEGEEAKGEMEIATPSAGASSAWLSREVLAAVDLARWLAIRGFTTDVCGFATNEEGAALFEPRRRLVNRAILVVLFLRWRVSSAPSWKLILWASVCTILEGPEMVIPLKSLGNA